LPSAVAGQFAVSVHVPVPLFIVTIAVAALVVDVCPLIEQTPDVPRIVGVVPSLEVAVTVKGLVPVGLYGAVAGAPVKLTDGWAASAATMRGIAEACA
jgi:hypothetical protein